MPVAGFLSNGVVTPMLVGAISPCARNAFAAAMPAASDVCDPVDDADVAADDAAGEGLPARQRQPSTPVKDQG